MKSISQIFQFVLGIALVSTIVLPLFPKKVHSFLYGNKFDVHALNEKAKVQQQNLETTEKALGASHSDTTLAMNALAETYVDLGKNELAAPLLARVLALKLADPKADSLDVAIASDQLASTYMRMNQAQLALPLRRPPRFE